VAHSWIQSVGGSSSIGTLQQSVAKGVAGAKRPSTHRLLAHYLSIHVN